MCVHTHKHIYAHIYMYIVFFCAFGLMGKYGHWLTEYPHFCLFTSLVGDVGGACSFGPCKLEGSSKS